MTLEKLLEVVSDQQEIRLIGEGFDEITGFKTALECVLNEKVMQMPIDCVEASFEGELKVWVKADGK